MDFPLGSSFDLPYLVTRSVWHGVVQACGALLLYLSNEEEVQACGAVPH